MLAAGCIGAVNATVCDAGFYLKASKCATCPRGHKCDGSVRVRCKGFAPQVVSGDYIPMFQDEAGKTQCKECAACPNGAVRKNCHRASPGYCEPCPGGNTRATRFACTPCPAGTYAPSSLTCLPCQPGRFAQKGAALCSSCAPGTYTHLQKQHSCTACSTSVVRPSPPQPSTEAQRSCTPDPKRRSTCHLVTQLSAKLLFLSSFVRFFDLYSE